MTLPIPSFRPMNDAEKAMCDAHPNINPAIVITAMHTNAILEEALKANTVFVSVWASESHGPYCMVHKSEDDARAEIKRQDDGAFELEDGETAGADLRDIAIYRAVGGVIEQVDGLKSDRYMGLAVELLKANADGGWEGSTPTSKWR